MGAAGPIETGETARAFASAGASPRSKSPVSIEIALATFNSALFLPELLESLFAQTCQDFTLLVSDDGSSDATLDIVADYQRRHPGRIGTIGSSDRLGSALANFSWLIAHLTADYALFCDHDDVWLPNKIALSLDRMRSMEAEHGPSTPLLVHTDLAVVGHRLEPICPSSFSYQKIDPRRNALHSLLMANTVSGCAAMVNRTLYERARPVPPGAVMHDHWLALIAAASGRIGCIEESTILYRQHERNAIGAVRWGAASIIDRVRQTLFEDSKRRVLERLSDQARALLSRCGEAMSPDQYRAAAAFANLWSVNRWRRFPSLWRHGLLLNGMVRNIALFITVTGRSRRRIPPAGPAGRAGPVRVP